jgi:hypothetical protein
MAPMNVAMIWNATVSRGFVATSIEFVHGLLRPMPGLPTSAATSPVQVPEASHHLPRLSYLHGEPDGCARMTDAALLWRGQLI